LMSTLARQIDGARNHAALASHRGGDDALHDEVLRSLRSTFLVLSAGLDPEKDAPHLFLLSVSECGEHRLSQDGATIPVNAPFLAYLFWTAGVDLAPGQFLFLEPELAKAAIEEALGRTALEQAFADREWVSRRTAMATSIALPGSEEIDSLRALETRANLLWDRKIELIAASLIADEVVERSAAADPQQEAA